MSTHRFSRGQKFVWKGVPYTVLQRRGDTVNIEDYTGALTTIDCAVLIEDLFSEKLRFVTESTHGENTANEVHSTESKRQDLLLYPSHLVEVARYREEAIKPLVQLSRKERTRKHFEDRAIELRAKQDNVSKGGLLSSTSPASLYEWVRIYEQSGHDLRTLIPATYKRGGKGKSRFPSDVEIIIEAVIDERYNVREQATIEDVFQEVALRIIEFNSFAPKAKQLRTPSMRTIARRVSAMDGIALYAKKNGKRAATRKFSQYGQTERPLLPLERVEIDHTIIDVIVVDPDGQPLGRPTFTVALDVATAYPLGYYIGFEPPSVLTVVECLYHSICTKEDIMEKYGTKHRWVSYGIPKTLVVDNGKEFRGRDLQDACDLLGIDLQPTKVATPNEKGAIERFFRSINTLLWHKIPGTTFSNPRERGDYDSSKKAVLTIDELERVLVIALIDIYAERFHRGIKDIPARRWEAALQSGFAPRLPANREELSIQLGRVAERTIHHYGIEFEGLRYNCPELSLLRDPQNENPRVTIKYHPGDISYIYVQDTKQGRYIKVPALAHEHTQGGISLWKNRFLRKSALEKQKIVDSASLAEARRRIEEEIQKGRSNKRRRARLLLAPGQSSRMIAPATDESEELEITMPPVSAETTEAIPEELRVEDPHELEDWGEITYELLRTDSKKE